MLKISIFLEIGECGRVSTQFKLLNTFNLFDADLISRFRFSATTITSSNHTHYISVFN